MTDEATIPETYLTIPESNLGRMEDKIAKLNRRASKLGLSPIQVTEISRETRKEYVGRTTDGKDVFTHRLWLTLDVQGDKPTVPNWTLVGGIDHGDVTDGTINVLRAPRGETIPESYRKARPFCGHCRTTRRRRDTFILRGPAGSHMQVGRNCLADFLGAGTTAAQIVGWLKFIREIETMGGEYEKDDFASGPSDYEGTGRYLAATAAAVRVNGWTSRGRAYEDGGASTADQAWSVLYPSPKERERADHPKVTPDDVDVSEKALAWIRNLPESERASDYLANLYAACARDGFRRKQDGVVASLVGAAFPRSMRDAEKARREAAEAEGRRIAAEAKGISKHVGEPKQRLRDVAVTIEKIRGWEGTFGYVTLVAMRDDSNNLLVWYASGDVADNLPTEGASCLLTGTVKRHGDDKYTGEAATYVNRCKLASAELAQAAC